jgi:hypothetical protein
VDTERVFKVHRAAREVARDPSSDDDLTVARHHTDGFDRVMVLFSGFRVPSLNGGSTPESSAFISHHAVVDETARGTIITNAARDIVATLLAPPVTPRRS